MNEHVCPVFSRILFKDKDRNWDEIENKLRSESDIPLLKTSNKVQKHVCMNNISYENCRILGELIFFFSPPFCRRSPQFCLNSRESRSSFKVKTHNHMSTKNKYELTWTRNIPKQTDVCLNINIKEGEQQKSETKTLIIIKYLIHNMWQTFVCRIPRCELTSELCVHCDSWRWFSHKNLSVFQSQSSMLWSTQMGLLMPLPVSAWPAPPPLPSPKPPKQLPPLPPAPGLHPQPKIYCRRSFLGPEDHQPGFRLPLPAQRRLHETPARVWG